MAHNSDRQDGLKSLREWLEQFGAGSIEDIATLTSKLVNAWPALAGGEDEGMTAAKLGRRVDVRLHHRDAFYGNADLELIRK